MRGDKNAVFHRSWRGTIWKCPEKKRKSCQVVPPQKKTGRDGGALWEMQMPARSCRCRQDRAAGPPHTLRCWHQAVDLALQSSGFLRWRQSEGGTWAGLRLGWKGGFLSCGEREWTPSLSWTPSNAGGSVDESEVTQPLRKRKGYGEPRDGGDWTAYSPRGHAYFSRRFWL